MRRNVGSDTVGSYLALGYNCFKPFFGVAYNREGFCVPESLLEVLVQEFFHMMEVKVTEPPGEASED